MTIQKLTTGAGDELYEQLSPETLSRAVVLCYHEDGSFSFMVSEMDAAELALAASIMSQHAALAALGGSDDEQGGSSVFNHG